MKLTLRLSDFWSVFSESETDEGLVIVGRGLLVPLPMIEAEWLEQVG